MIKFDLLIPHNVVSLFRLSVDIGGWHRHVNPCQFQTPAADLAQSIIAQTLLAFDLVTTHRLEQCRLLKTHLAQWDQENVVDSQVMEEGESLLGFSYEKKNNKLRAF